jgi:hypothetical protein
VAPSPTNAALARLLRRAEGEDPGTLVQTFVDANALFARLSGRDDQIVFGRRGTGKTHALLYLAETLRSQGQTVVYADLRLLGSSGGIYADAGISVAEAGTRLLVDALQHVYDELVDQALTGSATMSDMALARLDRFGDTISEVSVVGETEERTKAAVEASGEIAAGLAGSMTPAGPRLSAFSRAREAGRLGAEKETLLRGVARHRVHFGSVAGALKRLIPALAGNRLWLLLDEWSHVPLHLQPLLADLLRHCVLPIPGVTVKIAAIDQRSAFALDREDGSYIGLELGADLAADIDLDEFMVFSYERDAAVDFFAQLFHRHVGALTADAPGAISPVDPFGSPEQFVSAAFASEAAFRELVRAAEGVPRDAINIASKAALHADADKIGLQHVRDAAHSWYLLDKAASLKAKPDARDLLHWIIDKVIGRRRARGFLVRQGTESHLSEWLYDARLIHLIKRGMAAKDQPGVRYDAYAVDFGCYVDLLAARSASPRGLFRTEDDDFVDVPPDDLEVIRNAILDLDSFVPPPPPESERAQPPDPPTVLLRGHAREGSRVVESVPDAPAALERPGWYLLVETSRGILAVPIGRRATRVGSATSDHFRIGHRSVMPRHAVVEVVDDGPLLVRDKHGTVNVNDRAVELARLVDRDHVQIGEIDLLVLHVPSPSAPPEERNGD